MLFYVLQGAPGTAAGQDETISSSNMRDPVSKIYIPASCIQCVYFQELQTIDSQKFFKRVSDKFLKKSVRKMSPRMKPNLSPCS